LCILSSTRQLSCAALRRGVESTTWGEKIQQLCDLDGEEASQQQRSGLPRNARLLLARLSRPGGRRHATKRVPRTHKFNETLALGDLLSKALPKTKSLCRNHAPPFIANISKGGAVHVRYPKRRPAESSKR